MTAPQDIAFIVPGAPVGKQRARTYQDWRTGRTRTITPDWLKEQMAEEAAG